MFRLHRTRAALLLILVAGMLAASAQADRPAIAAGGPALSVDAAADRHPISPDIYGMNFAEEALAKELRLPVRRWGGNSTTRYNWQIDVHNTGSDYYYENIPDGNSATLPNDSSADRFVEQDRRTGAETLMTVPLIGWTPKQRLEDHPYDCGFPKTQFQSQLSFDPYDSNCGDGLNLSCQPVTSSSTASNTSKQIGPPFVQDWVRHLIGRYGTAAQGGVRFYNLDNEPGLWNSTHRDVHPAHPTYDELTSLGQQYAAAIKAVDPAAQTLGPVQDGWTRYYYASYDTYPDQVAQDDRDAHGGKPFVEWYLQQMKAYEQQHGQRVLDYFDLHYYPQAEGVALQPAGGADTQALRLRSTRALWDPTYVDESWIKDTEEGNTAVQLIPRMRDWVSQNYPGTRLAISEYNWGALDHINGALAQADVLGIFGRERVDLANLWSPPAASDPGAFAFRMYRNYDGRGGAFGDVGVRAASADQAQLAIYAARRSRDGSLTLMIINKTGGDLTSSVGLAGFSPVGSAQVYRYSPANLNAIVKQPNQAVSGSGFSATFPANSITLVVVPPAQASRNLYLPLTKR
jgi:glycosyl hydrolase family 44